MAMTLRPSGEQTERLRKQAESEGRSMQAVVLSAIDEYIDRRQRRRRVTELAEQGAERYREALDRLGSI
jgi:predicted transcriptional regulator